MDLEFFKDFLVNRDCSELTIKAYCNDLEIFSHWFFQTNGQELIPQCLTPTDLREYKQFLLLQQHARPTTINRKIASIRMFVNYALETNQISYNPISGIKGVEEEVLSPKWLTKLEQAALMREFEKHILSSKTKQRYIESVRNKTILVVLINTGIRLSELCNLEVSDVLISDRKGHIIVRNGKGMKTRFVPLNQNARKAITDWLTIRPINSIQSLFVGVRGKIKPRAIQEMMKDMGEKAHLSISPHVLRHCFGKNLVDTGQVSLDKVAMLMGHSSLSTTSIYTKPSLKDLDIVVHQLDF